MFKNTKSFLVLLLVCILLTVVACSQADSDATSTEGESEENGEKIKIGVALSTLNNPFFVAMKQGAEEIAEQYDADVYIESADYDLATQVRQMEDFITKGVDLILLNAADTKGIAAAVQQAKEAGIPIVSVDVEAEGGVDATVTADNFQAGQIAAEYLVERLNGEGNIVVINGPPISPVMLRIEGLEAAIEGTNIKVIAEQNGEAQREPSQRVMEDILQANPEGTIDAVFAINDPTGLGAMTAAEQANRDDFFIVGIDGSPDAVEALKDGTIFAASSAQDPKEQIYKAAEIGMNILNGEEVEESVIYIPTELITSDNVDEFEGWLD